MTAVEIDRDLVAHLREAFALELAAGALELVEDDVLDADLAALVARAVRRRRQPAVPRHEPGPAPPPRRDRRPRPERCVLMVQREVAERIAARPGAMSYLSVFVQYHAEPTLVRRVPAAAFEPAPAVESAVLALDVRPPDAPGRLPPAMEDDLWRLVQAGFRERRKMLHNVLPRQLPIEPATIAAALAEAGIDRDRRPQTLGVGEWIALLGALGPIPADRRGRRARRRAEPGRPTPADRCRVRCRPGAGP